MSISPGEVELYQERVATMFADIPPRQLEEECAMALLHFAHDPCEVRAHVLIATAAAILWYNELSFKPSSTGFYSDISYEAREEALFALGQETYIPPSSVISTVVNSALGAGATARIIQEFNDACNVLELDQEEEFI